MSKESKPFYKKWWVWVIGIFVFIMILGAIGSSDDDSSSSDGVSTTAGKTKKKANLSKVYKVGQTINYKGYKITVNNVDFSNGDEYDKPKAGNRYVVIKVTIKNDTDDKQDYNPYDFKLSADGNSTDLDESTGNDTYDNNTLDDGTLSKGASTTGYLIGQAKDSAKLKLQYQPSYFDDNTVDIDLN